MQRRGSFVRPSCSAASGSSAAELLCFPAAALTADWFQPTAGFITGAEMQCILSATPRFSWSSRRGQRRAALRVEPLAPSHTAPQKHCRMRNIALCLKLSENDTTIGAAAVLLHPKASLTSCCLSFPSLYLCYFRLPLIVIVASPLLPVTSLFPPIDSQSD